jgi:alpha-glucosidase
MQQAAIPPDRLRDPIKDSIVGLQHGRDSVRTPMQWDASTFAGFSNAEPWLPIADNSHGRNVAEERSDATSIYHLYRRLIALRRTSLALLDGAYRTVMTWGSLLVFARIDDRERMLIALNLGSDSIPAIPRAIDWRGVVAASTLADRDGEIVDGGVALRGNEGLVIRLDRDWVLPSTQLT